MPSLLPGPITLLQGVVCERATDARDAASRRLNWLADMRCFPLKMDTRGMFNGDC